MITDRAGSHSVLFTITCQSKIMNPHSEKVLEPVLMTRNVRGNQESKKTNFAWLWKWSRFENVSLVLHTNVNRLLVPKTILGFVSAFVFLSNIYMRNKGVVMRKSCLSYSMFLRPNAPVVTSRMLKKTSMTNCLNYKILVESKTFRIWQEPEHLYKLHKQT